jgi:hypothetical protein
MKWMLVAVPIGAMLAACAQEKPAPQQQAPSQPPPAPALPPPPEKQPAPAPPVAPIRPTNPEPAQAGLREVFPGVRADVDRKLVEFDGIVAINVHDPKTPIVYLEVVVCTPDTKEHEALVVTKVKPSHVHAALLAVGLEPGAPGSWKWEDQKLTPIPPRGAPVNVSLVYSDPDGRSVEAPATAWIVNAEGEKPFSNPGEYFVFAGSEIRSRQGQEVYEADGAGTLVGLATFGTETVAWSRTFSPDSEVAEPEWIANRKLVPAFNTPVTVRIEMRRER